MNLRSSGTRKTAKSLRPDPHRLTLMRVFYGHRLRLKPIDVFASVYVMAGLTQDIEPASETYAGYAWDFLSRNPAYRDDYLKHRPNGLSPKSADHGGRVRTEINSDIAANKWGLETFANPDESALKAFVIWRPSVFIAALAVLYGDSKSVPAAGNSFDISSIDCTRHHFIDAKNVRHTVIKSADFWLQIYGETTKPLDETLLFSVMFPGQDGVRRRIDALRQLTSLSLGGVQNFALFGRQKARIRLRNALIAFDINAQGGTYRDVAIALFGYEIVTEDWDASGGFLKNRAVRAYKLGERMVAQDYLTLLPKKII